MGEKNNNIGFIGAGKMATAIMKGIIDSNFLDSKSVFAYDVNEVALKNAQKNLKVNITTNLDELFMNCPVVVIATKPFVINDVLVKIEDKIRNHLIISILAGVSTKKIEQKLYNTRVVRVMPNTPALVGCGMSAVCGGKFAYENDVKYVLELFSKLGEAIEIDEKDIDIVTAISGSGPAFFYYFIDKIARAGQKLGLDYETSLKLASQTALGSSIMIQKATETPQELIDNVTTPGGCTEIGNNILINSKTEDILFKVIKRTMEKAKKLGG